MPAPSTRRITVHAPVLAALCGALAGLGSFALCAALWRTGQPRLAAAAGQGILVLALSGLAAFVLLAQPPRPRRARVAVALELRGRGRQLPGDPDPVPILAICAGTPLVAGAAAALLLFH